MYKRYIFLGVDTLMTKKFFSIITAIVSLLSCISLTSYAVDYVNYFDFIYSSMYGGGYLATLKTSGIDLSSLNEIIVPEAFEDGSHGNLNVILNKAAPSSANTTIETLTTKSSYGSIMMSAFQNLNALEKVEYTNLDKLIFREATFQNCSSTLTNVTIYATTVEFDSGRFATAAFTSFIGNPGAKIHVVSDAVKQQIINGTASGSAPVTEDMIVVDVTDDRPVPKIKVTCDDIKYDNSWTPSVEVTYVNVEEETIPVEDPQVTYALFKDEDCVQSAGEFLQNEEGKFTKTPQPGTYYLKATLTGTSDYQGGSEVIPVKVLAWADKGELNKAIEEANAIILDENGAEIDSNSSEYVPNTFGNLKRAVHSATMSNFRNTDPNVSGYDAENSNPRQSTLADPKACQAEVDYVTNAIRTAIKGLLKPGEVVSEEIAARVRARYNKFANVSETNYTSDSFAAFKTAKDSLSDAFNKLTMGTLTNDVALGAISGIDEAYSKLLYKNPPSFDELKAAVEQANSYKDKKDTYTEDTFESLTSALKESNDLLTQYADKGELETTEVVETDLQDAEVEFRFKVPAIKQSDVNNATSKLQKAISGLVTPEQRAAFNDIQEKISDVAKNYSDPDLFTTSSYAALTEALTTANNVKETDDVEDIKSAAEALQKAIDGLKNVEGYLPAGDPIKYIKFGYNPDPLISGVYDGKSAATQVRLTFNCAPDTCFDGYSSIELQVKVDETEIGYAKLTGKNATSENGVKNAKAVLKLNTPLEVGQNYLLNAFTYSWEGKEYAYAVTKIEFLDDEGNILKAFNDIEAARESLKQSVEAAKKLAEDEYTAESYAKVVEAIAEAEKVIANENATKSELEAAAAALREAIGDLKDKDSSQGGSSNQTVKPTTPTKAAPITTRSREVVKKDKSKAKQAMKTAKITKLKVKSKTKKKINVTWKKVKKAKGYQVQVSTSKKFKKSKIIFNKFTKKKTLKIASKKIKSKKTYYVRVRAYTTYNDINGEPQKVYSKWNKKLRTVKVK